MITASGLRWAPTNTGPSPCTRFNVADRPARNSRNESTSGVLMGGSVPGCVRIRVRVTPSGVAGGRPEVDPAVHGVLVDLRQLVRGELRGLPRGEAVLELGHAARADQHRR